MHDMVIMTSFFMEACKPALVCMHLYVIEIMEIPQIYNSTLPTDNTQAFYPTIITDQK